MLVGMASIGDRRAGLDGVRGIAILLVVCGHVAAGTILGYASAAGVTLFFALSGYLITRLLAAEFIRTNRLDFPRFYARRALRLLPALVVLVCGTGALLWVFGSPLVENYPAQAGAALLYAGNLIVAAGGNMGTLGHTWSLAVEEQFYLLWPFILCIILQRLSVQTAARFVGLLAAIGVLWRTVATFAFGYARVYVMLDTSAFALLLGAALALREIAGVARFYEGNGVAVLGLSALVSLSLLPITDSYDTIVGVGAPVAAVIGLLLVRAGRSNAPVLATPLLCWFGRLSYGWYLWHQVILKLSGTDGPTFPGPERVLAALLALGLAWLSWRYVEKPFLDLKDRLGPPQGLENSQTLDRATIT